MRVLFVCSGNSEAGISPFVRSQGESLERACIELDYFTILGKGAIAYLRNIPRLKKLLGGKNYDLIHAHYGLCGIVSELSRKREKLVVSFMGDDLIGSNNNDGSYTMKSKLIAGVNKYFALKRYDFNIVKSKELEKIINRALNRRIICNGVDFKTFFPMGREVSREILGRNKKQKIVLFVATNPKRKEKNFALAKKACEMIKCSNVILIPLHGVNQEILNLHYNAADVVLLTSYHEGSPNVIKEAMACNCPIVSTDVGDLRGVIGNTEGCYITSYDPEDVAEKVRMASKFGSTTRGRDRLIQLGLDSVTIANKIISVYQQVLERA